MNPPIKRLLAFAGSVAAGLVGAIVIASPAQAHHPIITGSSVCQADGKYQVTWTVGNGNWENPFMKIIAVTPTPNTPVSNITVGTRLDPDRSVTGVQFVPGNVREAKLYVDAYWYRTRTSDTPRVHDSRTGTVRLPGTCTAEPGPTATFDDRCDGTINVHLVNPTNSTKTFRIRSTDDENDYVRIVELGTDEQDVAVPSSAGAIVAEVKTGRTTWQALGRHDAWSRPEDCPPPTVFAWSTCDKLTVKVTNSEKAEPTTATVSYGTQPKQTRTVAPGETETFEFFASSATEATVELTGWDTVKVKYEKPADCDILPKTGPDTTTYVASGTGLAVLGGLAFFFARRRMTKLRKLASY